jgi:hypothetical protein
MHALSNFVLEVPDCAPDPIASSPAGGTAGTDPNSGITGIKWNLTIQPDDTVGRSFSITYPGDVPPGLIDFAVKVSTTVEMGAISGPCKGFLISGIAFVDPDSNGIREPVAEPGIIANLTVTLIDASGSIETTTTDASGHYEFFRGDGEYTLQIDSVTAANDFNEELADSFDPTTSLSRIVTIGPDSPDNDFGFRPQTEELILEIQEGILLTDGESVKFWTREVRLASKSGGPKGEFDSATILGFLLEIETLFLESPYQFEDGNEYASALAILTDNNKDPLVQLKRQLLATELNEMSDKGLFQDRPLQRVLISWGESLVFSAENANGAAAGAVSKFESGGSVTSSATSSTDLNSAEMLFKQVNGRGGGNDPIGG